MIDALCSKLVCVDVNAAAPYSPLSRNRLCVTSVSCAPNATNPLPLKPFTVKPVTTVPFRYFVTTPVSRFANGDSTQMPLRLVGSSGLKHLLPGCGVAGGTIVAS